MSEDDDDFVMTVRSFSIVFHQKFLLFFVHKLLRTHSGLY